MLKIPYAIQNIECPEVATFTSDTLVEWATVESTAWEVIVTPLETTKAGYVESMNTVKTANDNDAKKGRR